MSKIKKYIAVGLTCLAIGFVTGYRRGFTRGLPNYVCITHIDDKVAGIVTNNRAHRPSVFYCVKEKPGEEILGIARAPRLCYDKEQWYVGWGDQLSKGDPHLSNNHYIEHEQFDRYRSRMAKIVEDPNCKDSLFKLKSHCGVSTFFYFGKIEDCKK